MATLDIRKNPEPPKIHRIIFADGSQDGLSKACYLDDAYPVQCDIVSRGGDRVHVKYKDIDHLIAALQKAKELWHKP